jgi:hypothetical protein
LEYRQIGKTNLKISEISIGLEWLYKKKEEDIATFIKEAINSEVNYFDIIFNHENFLREVKKGITVPREKLVLNHHLGSSIYKGKYKKTRSVPKCQEHFDNYLDILEIDYVDFLFLHFIFNTKQFVECWKEGGVKDLALQLKEEGKAKHLAISTHNMNVAIEAAKSGIIDAIMIQINLANHAHPKRAEMLATCEQEGVGVIAMKPFSGGRLLEVNKTVSFAKYQTASHNIDKKKIPETATSAQCLHYVLSQPAIAAAVPGAANLTELKDCLAYYSVPEEQRDYSQLLKSFDEYTTGECVYGNHCLPCPADIDIGPMFRLFDVATITEDKANATKEYNQFQAKASDCIECGECEKRCPFEVDIIKKMKEIATYFGK